MCKTLTDFVQMCGCHVESAYSTKAWVFNLGRTDCSLDGELGLRQEGQGNSQGNSQGISQGSRQSYGQGNSQGYRQSYGQGNSQGNT